MKYIKNLGLCFTVVFALSGCMVAPLMSAAIGAKSMMRAQGRSETIDFAYAKEKVVVGETTKADITKNLGEPNKVIQDTNEVWKYEQRVIFGFGSGSQGDFTQVSVAFNGNGVVAAIAGSDSQGKKEVKFARGDLRLLPFMPGQSRSMVTPQQQQSVDSAPAPVATQPESAPVVDPEVGPPPPVKKAKAKVKPKVQKTPPSATASTLM